MGCRALRDLRDLLPSGSGTWLKADEQYRECLRNEGIAATIDAVTNLLARKAALKFVLCRTGGGTMEECMGFYRVLVPPPPGPEFDEWFDDLSHEERVMARGFLREILLTCAKEFDGVP